MFGVVGFIGALVLVLSLVFDDALDSVLPDAGWISGPILGAFAAAFGLVGWVVHESVGPPTLVSAAAGIVGGVALGAFTARLTAALMSSPTDGTPTIESVIGSEGTVVTPVRANGLGEVVVRLGGQPVKLTATSGHDLASGTRVTVVAAESSTKVVVEATSAFWS